MDVRQALEAKPQGSFESGLALDLVVERLKDILTRRISGQTVPSKLPVPKSLVTMAPTRKVRLVTAHGPEEGIHAHGNLGYLHNW